MLVLDALVYILSLRQFNPCKIKACQLYYLFKDKSWRNNLNWQFQSVVKFILSR